MPTPHAAAAILLAIAMFYGFASGRARIEIISLLTIAVIAVGLYFFPLEGSSPSAGLALAFEGFGHTALVTICALMVLGRGLVVTGALNPASRILNSVWGFSQPFGFLLTIVIAAGLSMVVNDTPVLVLLLPILVQLGQGRGYSPSKTLIPVNAAILIGGMATTIGTSTNLLVVSIATDMGMKPIGIFHYTELVLFAALVALPYIWLVMPRLLRDNSAGAALGPREFRAILRIAPSSRLFGQDAGELRVVLPPQVRFVSMTPGPIHAESRFVLSGTEALLEEAARVSGGALAPHWLIERLSRESAESAEDLKLVEMIVAPDSRLLGKTPQSAGLEGVALLGVHVARNSGYGGQARQNPDIFAEGDVLLVLGIEPKLQQFAQRDGLLILEGGRELPRSNKATLALAIMGGVIALASTGLMPIAIASLGGAILMFVTGCVKFERVGRALSAQVIVLVAASIALGKVMLVSGAAQWLGEQMAGGLQYLAPAAVLALVMLFVAILTNFASNATAAAVGTPIAFSLAGQLQLPAEPLVLAVLFGCNLCYATPFGYQTNMMIMAEGDYRFGDYVRTGLPLAIIMIVCLSAGLVWRYAL